MVLVLTLDGMLFIVVGLSNWPILLRFTALVYRFLLNCKAKMSKCVHRTGFIFLGEMNQAKEFWIVRAQRESFAKEMSSL